jgi:transposase, IS30 family
MASHLTLQEREIVAQMLHDHRKQCEIAEKLERDPGTISRELSRNRSRNGYWASTAQAMADTRCSQRPRICKMEQPEVSRYVRERLRQYWSPDEIAGRSRLDFPNDSRRHISRQTIYTWLHAQQAAGAQWYRYLRRLGCPRNPLEKRGQLPACISIEGRPAIVDRRVRYGDWEGDTVVGRWHQGGAVTLVDRKSGYLLLHRIPDRQATTVREAIAELFRPLPSSLRRTLTLDNGKEFAEHKQLSREAALDVYFAKPYCAWQRGTNENTNGLVRQFFPKGSDLAHTPVRRIEKVQHLLNNRPRRRLGYQTPLETLGSRLRCN